MTSRRSERYRPWTDCIGQALTVHCSPPTRTVSVANHATSVVGLVDCGRAHGGMPTNAHAILAGIQRQRLAHELAGHR